MGRAIISAIQLSGVLCWSCFRGAGRLPHGFQNEDMPISKESTPLSPSKKPIHAGSALPQSNFGVHSKTHISEPGPGKETSVNSSRQPGLIGYQPGVIGAEPFGGFHGPRSLPAITDMHSESTHLVYRQEGGAAGVSGTQQHFPGLSKGPKAAGECGHLIPYSERTPSPATSLPPSHWECQQREDGENLRCLWAPG